MNGMKYTQHKRVNDGERFGVFDALKTYINPQTERTPQIEYTVDDFLPSVAYLEDGKIKCRMYDTFIILPGPINVHGVPITKEYFDCYTRIIYKPERNIFALEEAAHLTGESLNEPDYTVNILLPLFRPLKKFPDFGEITGIRLNCSDDSGRLAAIKWMIDEHIRLFFSYDFEHIKLAGFYWFDEFLDEAEDGSLIINMNEYIHSKGLASFWSPFFRAKGFDCGKKCGFDMVTMQANYFPAIPDAPNAGPIERLYDNAELCYKNGMGIELERHTDGAPIGDRALKEYMYAGLETGYIDALHAYYIGGGPKDIRGLCFSYGYKQSVYSDLHKFIMKKIKKDDIILDF